MSEISTEIKTQKPIQVKKISQLPELFLDTNNEEVTAYYYNEDGIKTDLDINNAYILIGYPSNDDSIPHNYKIKLSQLLF